jgi:hypothetical protein
VATRRSGAASKHVRSSVERVEQLARGQTPDAGGAELYRQRETVEALADIDDHLAILG